MAGKERRTHIITKLTVLIKKLLNMSLVRYALVGGIGIPVNLLALALFLNLFGYYRPHPFPLVYSIAYICAFEVSTIVNFVLNQTFTYREQMQHIHGLGEWIKRAVKAQTTSLSANLLSFVIAQVLNYGLHVSPYIASLTGIVVSFAYNYVISKRFVYRSVPPTNTPAHGDLTTESEAAVIKQPGVPVESASGD